jgi:hypothetical protein
LLSPQIDRRRDLNFEYIQHIEHGDSRRAAVTNGISFMDVSILVNTALTERLDLWDNSVRRFLENRCNWQSRSPFHFTWNSQTAGQLKLSRLFHAALLEYSEV